MKRNALIIIAMSAFLFASCSGEANSSTDSSHSSSSISDDSSSISGGDSSSTSSDDGNKDDDDSGDDDDDDKVIDLGKKSIKEARELCSTYIKETDLNVSKCAVNKNYKITIEGLAIYKTDLVKTKASYGLDISPSQKVILGDETGYISVASRELLNKVSSYIGDEQSSYSVTGYLSIYLGHPEIYLESYTWDASLNKKFDAFVSCDDEISIDEFSELVSNVNYNCAGHGFGEIYSLKSLKCIYEDKSSNKYVLSDGKRVIKAIGNNSKNIKFTLGSVYDVAGLISTLNYEPAMVVIASKISAVTVELALDDNAFNLSIDSLRSTLKASQDDTDKKYPEFIQGFQYIYSADVYISACVENGNYYMIASDSYSTSKTYTTGKGNTAANYNAALLRNDSLWNRSYAELNSDKISINPFRDYLDEEKTITIYFFRWQLDYYNKKTAWTIFLLSDFFPSEDSSLA